MKAELNQDDIKTIKFVKLCLKDAGYSKELIAYLLSEYDLKEYLKTSTMTKLELATHFLGHARAINEASQTY